jgi:DNA polymerase III subunit gamma/tau
MFFLANILKNGFDFPPVLMFCGPSGVGKTTLARIVAAAVNCTERGEGANEPCRECDDCQAIFSDTHPAVVELDAAVNSGADDMRRIRDQAYTQAPGKVQVFIIDEVHSASAQAWNVLLKLFEEPPAGVCFMLLTSEPHRVPTKIRTRAMRLDFGKVPPAKIKERLASIADAEGWTDWQQHDNLLDTICDLSDGSLREAVMLFEQLHLSGPQAVESLSIRDRSLELIHAAMRRDRIEGMKILTEAYERTGDFRGILTMWGLAMEKVLLHKHSIPTFVSPSRENFLRELSSGMDDTQWAAAMEVLADWSNRVVSRAHLSFVWVAFLKALHGPTVATLTMAASTKPDAPEVFEEGELEAFMQGM